MRALLSVPSRRHRPRVLAAATTVALLAGLWSAAPTQAEPQRDDVLTAPAAAAVKVLEDVRDTLAAPEGTDLTVALAQLHGVYADLPTAERREVRALLARPTDPSLDPVQDLLNYGKVKPFAKCNTRICVHWTESGEHSVTGDDAAASDGLGQTVPAWVDTTLEVVDEVWTTEVETLGYRRPSGDGTVGNPKNNQRADLLDVYLGELGRDGYYGYANWDQAAPRGSYLVLDNDFAEFNTEPLEALQATVAHEFFHTVQFAYHRGVDVWLMEASATWMEERLYTAVNDNRQYLEFGSLREPGQPLDTPGFAQYGNWIFFQYLTQLYGDDVLRDVLELSVGGTNHSMQALNKALKKRGTKLADTFADFSAANVVRGKTYPEGSAYPKPRSHRMRKVSKRKRGTGWLTDRLDHLAASNNPVKATKKLGKKWRLRVDVKRSDKRQRARVVVLRTDGSFRVRRVKFTRGAGRVRVPFGTTAVKRVIVTLVNSSSRYRCKQRTAFACKGTPKDDSAPIRYRARLQKRS